MNTSPMDDLEAQALEQRNQLHDRAMELKGKVKAARERLDFTKDTRDHFLVFAIVAGGAALLSGYVVAGRFTKN
ncbi:MAG: hypothetical protein JOZ33_04440 [Acidobacteriaceae bacterium]|nr:hypothetical protein [Acidobacteriaceae bacterium]